MGVCFETESGNVLRGAKDLFYLTPSKLHDDEEEEEFLAMVDII